MPDELPAEDPDLSPFTGWGRGHWEAVADRLLAAARSHSSPRHAHVLYPGADASGGLEGFARIFLLAALRLAGARGRLPGALEWYAEALEAGTAPDSPERWPALTDHGQATVEATAIVVALHWTRPWIWDRLPQRTRDHVAGWLAPAVGSFCADNNHVLFGATIQAFLASAGYRHDRFGIEAALDRIEDFYAGDGWYSDGVGHRFDHYNAWTFHLYPFIILDLLGEPEDGARREVYRGRLEAFVTGYQHLFGPDGGPLIQGRSLIYRWGVAAPFWMAQLQGISTLSAGRTRRLASGVLRHFWDRGAVRDGVLGLGWHGDHPSILQSYNIAGSANWAAKGMLGLLLPADHEAWTAPEAPLPVEEHDTSVVLSGPGWRVAGSAADGVVRVLNFGSDGHPRQDSGLYRRVAFSTATVPALEPGPDGLPMRDNDVYVRGGGAISTHRGLRGGVARPDGGSSAFSLDIGGREVEVDYATTVIGATTGIGTGIGPVEVRVARLRGVLGLAPAVSGYPISSDEPVDRTAVDRTAVDSTTGPILARVSGRRRGATPDPAAPSRVSSELASTVPSSTLLTSTLTWLDSDAGLHPRPRCVEGPSTALGDYSALPVLELPPMRADTVRIAWLAVLGAPEETGADPLPGAELSWTDEGACVSWNGHKRVLPWVRAARWPADRASQGVFRWGDGPR